MTRFLLGRVLAGVGTLLVVLVISFLLLDLIPGDPASRLAGEDATPEQVKAMSERLGLDRPLPIRFGHYITDLFNGDLGSSLRTGTSVWGSISQALPVTASIALVTMVICVLLGVPLGVLAALNRDRAIDRLVSVWCAVALAVPAFVWALIALIVFNIDRSWLPATGYKPLSAGVGTWLSHLLLPSMALAVNSVAEIARQSRAAFLEALDSDSVLTSQALGLSRASIVGRHALRNAGIPIVTVFGLQLNRIMGGAIVVERIFAMPGMGSLAYDAVTRSDIPVVQGVVLVTAVSVLVANLMVDLSYPFINPKLRSTK